MKNDYEEHPPSYTDVTEKSDYHPSNGRAAAYTVPSSAPSGDVKYTVPSVTEPDTNAIQIHSMVQLGEKPMQCTCANCHLLIITQVKQKSGLLVWLLVSILILFGCWLGCCLIPFCIRDIKNTQHYCPNCKALIGEYRPL